MPNLKTKLHATVNTGELTAALYRVVKMVDQRVNIPILAYVKIDTTLPGFLTITGTNLDQTLSSTAKCGMATLASTTEAVCVPAYTLLKLSRNFKAPTCELEVISVDGANTLHIHCGKSSLSLQTLPVVDFPEEPERKLDVAFSVKGSTLAGLFESVDFAMSTEDIRFYLRGIYLHVKDGKLFAAATDGHRLAVRSIAYPPGLEAFGQHQHGGVIIPADAVKTLKRLLSDFEGNVRVENCDGNQPRMVFSCEDFTLITKIVDGTFPDYHRVIPPTVGAVSLDARELAEGLQSVLAIGENGECVRFDFARNKPLKLSCTVFDTGTASEEIACAWDRPALAIGFNGKYLTEILRHLGDKAAMVALDIGDPSSPIRITKPIDDSVLYVLMPMRV